MDILESPRKEMEDVSKVKGLWEDLEGKGRILFGGMLWICNRKAAARKREIWRE